MKAFEKMKKKSKDADVVVCAGDLTIFEQNLDHILEKLNDLKKPVLIIPGNHENEDTLEQSTAQFDNIKWFLYFINRHIIRN